MIVISLATQKNSGLKSSMSKKKCWYLAVTQQKIMAIIWFIIAFAKFKSPILYAN